MRSLGIYILLFLFSNTIWGQKEIKIVNDNLTTKFIYHVKQIDEFESRFNNDKNSLFYKYWIEKSKAKKVPRKNHLESLFDDRKNWDKKLVDEFVKDICHEEILISFYDSNWFAQLESKFKYQKKTLDINLIASVDVLKNNASRWIITSVDASFFTSDCIDLPKPQDKTFLSPASHGNNFVGLHEAFNDIHNLQNYFAPIQSDNLLGFKKALYTKEIKYLGTEKIVYHFFQIPNWIFTVEYINDEKGLNTGWLISNLQKATETEKNHYKQKVLKFYN